MIENIALRKEVAMRQIIWIGSLLVVSFVFAEKAGVKIEDVNTDQETSITIKKGAQALKECVEYQIVDGKDEINSSPDFDRKKAYQDWKAECDKWRASMKEMNKDNQILQLSCNKARAGKDGEMTMYSSEGTYKVKVKIRENKN